MTNNTHLLPLKLGLIGCGAITESAHLPAALACQGIQVTALVDKNWPRAQFLEKQFGLSNVAVADYRDAASRVDAVIVALPNVLHADISTEFLSRGIHVLCEKPLAVNSNECAIMCEAAQKTSAVLATGLVTRFFPSTTQTRELLHSGFLGRVTSFDYEFGTAGGWSTVSGYTLQRSTSGGGVLVVSGSHFIDRMLYLFDDVAVQSYADDNCGGIEANCIARFSARVCGMPVTGRVTLSKTHMLRNRLRIEGEKGVLEVREGQSRTVLYYPADRNVRCEISPPEPQAAVEPDYFRIQLEDFLQAIRTGQKPCVEGREGARSVALMERCYEMATPLDEHWCNATLGRLAGAFPIDPGRQQLEGGGPVRQVQEVAQ